MSSNVIVVVPDNLLSVVGLCFHVAQVMLHDLFNNIFIEAGQRRLQVVHGFLTMEHCHGVCGILHKTNSPIGRRRRFDQIVVVSFGRFDILLRYLPSLDLSHQPAMSHPAPAQSHKPASPMAQSRVIGRRYLLLSCRWMNTCHIRVGSCTTVMRNELFLPNFVNRLTFVEFSQVDQQIY
jgi:hypothetical protein